MSTFSVRCVIRWKKRHEQKLEHLYEERITVWNASSCEEAIDLAEIEVKAYAEEEGFEALDLFQAFSTFEDFALPRQGMEVFSLLRESNLEANEYLNAFFDTETEHQGEYTGQ